MVSEMPVVMPLPAAHCTACSKKLPVGTSTKAPPSSADGLPAARHSSVTISARLQVLSGEKGAADVPVVAVVGAVGEGADGIYDLGVSAVFSINHAPEAFETARLRSRENLARTMRNVMRLLKA